MKRTHTHARLRQRSGEPKNIISRTEHPYPLVWPSLVAGYEPTITGARVTAVWAHHHASMVTAESVHRRASMVKVVWGRRREP